MNKKSLNGSCLCKSIVFKILGPLRGVINCHCSQCMQTHGNYGSYTSCHDEDLIFTSKENLNWYKSSKFAKRGFCRKCGASIFFKKLNDNKISISAGMLDNSTRLKSISNIFLEDKLSYYNLDNKLLNFLKYSK
jgi:hypothetical protein